MYISLECPVTKVNAQAGNIYSEGIDFPVLEMIVGFPVDADIFVSLTYLNNAGIKYTRSFRISSAPGDSSHTIWIKSVIKNHTQSILNEVNQHKKGNNHMIPSKNEYILNQLGKIVEQFQIQESLSDIDAARILVQLADEKIKIACDTYESKPFKQYGSTFETR